MPLVYLPERRALFLWGDDAKPPQLPGLDEAAQPDEADLIVPAGPRVVSGLRLPLLETMGKLAVLPAADLELLPASVAAWVLASKLAIELVARERVVPTLGRYQGRIEARWAAALSAPEDAARVAALAASMPPSAYAAAVHGGLEVWAPEASLRAYLDAVVDALVRGAQGGPTLPAARSPRMRRREPAPAAGWEQRFQAALVAPSNTNGFEASGFGERSVLEDLERWSESALGARDQLQTCFRLELPRAQDDRFVLRFLLQAPDDPSLLVPASEVWQLNGGRLEHLGRAFREPQDALLRGLGRAARLYAPLSQALTSARPEQLELDPAAAWTFLGEGAAALSEAGFVVSVPAELTSAGQRRLRLRMRIGAKSTKVAGAVAGTATLGLDELLDVDWQAIIGDDALSARELALLAKHKAPLVRHRGAWVAIDPNELSEIQRRIAGEPERITLREAVQAALAGEVRQEALSIDVSARGDFAQLLERVQGAASTEVGAPAALQAALRPYQARGLGWLSTMASLRLGACLADDMGLGKTVQVLAFLLRWSEQQSAQARPCLVVAPTSVVGNWEREAARFAPSLALVRHHGAQRLTSARELRPGALVLTSYGVLRRDSELLSSIDWAVVVLDEAQNIKNAASATARAARSLRASCRFALTGTPVENRLAELWSILEFANPGLLGPLELFRRQFALPIERYADQAAADRLRRVVSPFVLRRLKSDPAIIRDLPAKNEMKVICGLTREQASLYKAAVDEEMARIEQTEGIERRGRVLALLLFLKQICNHPAQYLSERGPLAQRSGKLERVTEMLEEALAAGDKALVFTQFRQMGTRLAAHFRDRLGCEVALLHGATPRQARDEMVRRFQEDPRGPRIFVLSLKAGGTGLNLTAANHVFHFDRWWNPAVEDQATDRAYRIGQTRSVQVHKLLCAGTVEEKVDRMLEQKRALASKVVGSGEQWITELGDSQLRDLFALSQEAVVGDDGDAQRAPATDDHDGGGQDRPTSKRARKPRHTAANGKRVGR
jgi:hypothetical protein